MVLYTCECQCKLPTQDVPLGAGDITLAEVTISSLTAFEAPCLLL